MKNKRIIWDDEGEIIRYADGSWVRVRVGKTIMISNRDMTWRLRNAYDAIQWWRRAEVCLRSVLNQIINNTHPVEFVRYEDEGRRIVFIWGEREGEFHLLVIAEEELSIASSLFWGFAPKEVELKGMVEDE